ncbi:MAG: hypothetical protein ABR526_02020 [Chthoniobacterales bacterium]
MIPSLPTDARRPQLRWFVHVFLAACLLAPSIWMLATIPPLWRDVDAYNQVTHSPAMATYWGNGALYCFASRVPLKIGAAIGPAAPGPTPPLLQPRLTDSGVLLLVGSQHLALVGAAFFFIITISSLAWVRLALGIVWMALAPLYTFSQCVGSETLSMIGVVVLAALGWRIVQRERTSRRTWVLYHLALLACLLTRYVNLWLILLLPATFLLAWLQTRLQMLSAPRQIRQRLAVGLGWKLRRALLALACGMCCIAASNISVRVVCHLAHLRFHSHAGPTFLWRLAFLKDLPAAERNQLLDRVASRVRSPDARQLLGLLRQTFDRGDNLDPAVFRQEARAFLSGPLTQRRGGGRTARALNEMAAAFLKPPTAAHLRAARYDFARARRMTPRDIDDSLFRATAFYFEHPDLMPQSAKLVTFRESSAQTINQIPKDHHYFGLGRSLSYNRCFVLWVSLLALMLILARKDSAAMRVVPYAIALTGAGIVMMFSTCLLGELLPRYTLPMWELLVVSIFMLVGGALEACVRLAKTAGVRPALRRAETTQPSPGQLPAFQSFRRDCRAMSPSLPCRR